MFWCPTNLFFVFLLDLVFLGKSWTPRCGSVCSCMILYPCCLRSDVWTAPSPTLEHTHTFLLVAQTLQDFATMTSFHAETAHLILLTFAPTQK